MATDEDQPKPVVLDILVIQRYDIARLVIGSLGQVCLPMKTSSNSKHELNHQNAKNYEIHVPILLESWIGMVALG